MLKPLIRTLNGWRFELPLALVLGAATAFAMIAMPWSLFGGLPAVVAFGMERPAQWAAAALAGLLSGAAGYRAMKHPWPRRAAAAFDGADEEDRQSPVAAALRLRRADAHPDFPPRAPIRASRDLGEPFMDIIGFADGSNASGAPVPSWVEIDDEGEQPVYVAEPAIKSEREAPEAGVPELAAFTPATIEAEPVETRTVTEWPLPTSASSEREAEAAAPVAPIDEDAVNALAEQPEAFPALAAFTPESEIAPALRPERARRESLAEMMERLSAGLERRAGKPVSPPPADRLADVLARPRAATPALRDALDELNRLAGRRG